MFHDDLLVPPPADPAHNGPHHVAHPTYYVSHNTDFAQYYGPITPVSLTREIYAVSGLEHTF